MNITTFTGNLGRDFELNYSGGGMAIAKNSLAVRRDFKNKQTGEYETDWIPITAFGKTAETMSNHLQKGSKIGVVGRLQTNEFTDKQGNKRTGYDVIVDRFEFLDSRQNNQQNQQNSQGNPFNNANFSSNDPFENTESTISDDSLPF